MNIPMAGRIASIDAGAALHASRRYRAQAFFQQCRQSPMSRRSSTTAASHAPTDSYIPFDGPTMARRVSDQQQKTAGSAAKRTNAVVKDSTRDDNSSTHDGYAVGIQAGNGEESLSAPGITDSKVASGDAVSVDQATQTGKRASSAKEATAKTALTAAPRTAREQSRLARKMRRIEAGTHNRDSQMRLQQDEAQADTVLAKLDELRTSETSVWSMFENNANPAPARKPLRDPNDLPIKQAITKPTKSEPKPKKEPWQIQKRVAEEKFGEAGWQPRKRLSPDTLEGIRALHASDQATYTTEMLSAHFKITPEAIRRILKSKWQPNDEEAEDRRARWERRGAKKWQEMAEQGMRAPAKWRAMGVGGEEGLKEDRLPARRRKKNAGEGLSWDDVVGGLPEHVEERSRNDSLADRLL